MLMNFAEKANKAKKEIVIFVGGDLDEDIPVDNAFIFHTSLYQSHRKERTFAMPALIDDLVEKYLCSQLPLRQKSPRPIVGFCGYAPPMGMSFGTHKLKEQVRLFLYYMPTKKFLPLKLGQSTRFVCLNNI